MPVTFELGQDHQDKHQNVMLGKRFSISRPNVKELLVKAFEKSAKALPQQCDRVTDGQAAVTILVQTRILGSKSQTNVQHDRWAFVGLFEPMKQRAGSN